MARVKILAGDFLQGEGEYRSGILSVQTLLYPSPGIDISSSAIKSIKIASATSAKRLEAATGLGLARAGELGPAGTAAGLAQGVRETEVTFRATLNDGRKFLAATDTKTYRHLAQSVAKPESFSAYE